MGALNSKKSHFVQTDKLMTLFSVPRIFYPDVIRYTEKDIELIGCVDDPYEGNISVLTIPSKANTVCSNLNVSIIKRNRQWFDTDPFVTKYNQVLLFNPISISFSRPKKSLLCYRNPLHVSKDGKETVFCNEIYLELYKQTNKFSHLVLEKLNVPETPKELFKDLGCGDSTKLETELTKPTLCIERKHFFLFRKNARMMVLENDTDKKIYRVYDFAMGISNLHLLPCGLFLVIHTKKDISLWHPNSNSLATIKLDNFIPYGNCEFKQNTRSVLDQKNQRLIISVPSSSSNVVFTNFCSIPLDPILFRQEDIQKHFEVLLMFFQKDVCPIILSYAKQRPEEILRIFEPKSEEVCCLTQKNLSYNISTTCCSMKKKRKREDSN